MLQRYVKTDARVILGPEIGEDVAALDMSDRLLIVTTDPITFATDEIGYYSVIINANDIATSGAVPTWYTATILLPEGRTTDSLVESIFQQIYRACQDVGVSLIGGHTEITYDLDRPIVVGQMIGEVRKGDLVRTGGAKLGDRILLTKGICIEGTSIIAREKETDLLSRGIPKNLIERAQRFLLDPGISVVREARMACRAGRVHSMHDITEGGLANGLHELSMAAGVHIVIEAESIPIYKESRRLCEAYGLNPLGVIGSGALLITTSPPEAERILQRAKQESLAITAIGWVEAVGAASVTMVTSGGHELVPYFERDELVRII